VFQVEVEAQRTRVGAGKRGGARGGSGDGGATWRGKDKAGRGREAVGAGDGGHVA
jgi:hypothetical protein